MYLHMFNSVSVVVSISSFSGFMGCHVVELQMRNSPFPSFKSTFYIRKGARLCCKWPPPSTGTRKAQHGLCGPNEQEKEE